MRIKWQVIKGMVDEARFRLEWDSCGAQSGEGGQQDYTTVRNGSSKQINMQESEVVRELHSWESLKPQERIILRAKGTETELVLRRVARCGPPAEEN